MKIIKHCQEEGAGGTDMVQGVLLGLVEGPRLEVTNCFPFPSRQSTYYGMYLNKALLDSQFNYQHSIEESIVLIYGEC